jgi:hypothetical protein
LYAQTPPEQPSLEAQSVSATQAHWAAVCVGLHVALGPHWLSVVQAWQFPPEQTSPGKHWLFAVQLGQPPLKHGSQNA